MDNSPGQLAKLASACLLHPSSTTAAETAAILLNCMQRRHNPPIAWLGPEERILAWGPQANGLILTARNNEIVLLSPAEMQAVHSWDHCVRPAAAAFGADGKFIVTKGEDDRVRVWAVQGFLLAEIAGVRAAFSEKGDKVVIISPDGKARIMHVAEPGRWVTITGFLGDQGESDLIRDVVDAGFFSSDKKIVAITHNPTEILVWDVEREQLTESLRLETEGNALRAITVTPDLRRAVTLCDPCTGSGFLLQHWDLQTCRAKPIDGGQTARNVIDVDDGGFDADGHPVWQHRGSLVVDGRALLATDAQHKIHFHRSCSVGAASRADAPGFPRLLGPVTDCVEVEGDYITTWRVADGRVSARTGFWNICGASGAEDIGFSPDSCWVWHDRADKASGTALYKNEPPPALSTRLEWESGWIGELGFSEDSGTLAAVAKHGTIRCYDTGSGALREDRFAAPNESHFFSEDRFVDVATMRLADAHTREPIAELERTGFELVSPRAAVSPDGRHMATSWGDERQRCSGLRLWRLISPKLDGPPPPWFANFLYFLAQCRVASSGVPEPLNRTEWSKLRRELLAVAGAQPATGSGYLSILRRFLRFEG